VVSPPTDLGTVAEYWERFFSNEVAIAKARATQHGYRAIFDSYIRQELGHEQLHDLISDRRMLVRWRSRLAEGKSHAVVVQAQRVLSSMLSAAEEGAIPHNPLLSPGRFGRRSSSHKLTRGRRARDPLAIDPSAWFLLMEQLRRGAGASAKDSRSRRPARLLERERGALMVALGFMAGLRLPSEALGLRHRDARAGRLYVEGRSSAGEYSSGGRGPRRCGS